MALLAGGLACASVRAQDDLPGRVGRVAETAGTVRTINPEGAWAAVLRNQPLSTGDRVTTDPTGRATLQFGSTVVRLGADTDVVVTQLDDQKIRLHFDHGQLAVRVRSDDIPGELSVETDEGAWVPHHLGEYRFDRAARGVLEAQSVAGDMLLEAADSSLPLSASQRAQVWRTGAQQATHYRLVPPVKDAFGDALLAADQADDKLAAVDAAMHLPPEMTGVADLARFGAWSLGPGDAYVWTPAKLPAGWAPYRQGAWSWNSPWGWTWIDDQPWGFAPFHYGRWLSVKGRWAWTPGEWGKTRPVYAPALVGWFGGAGVVVDGAPGLGWVALAPDEPVFPAYAVSAKYWNALSDASIAPAARRAVAINGRARLVPGGAVAYANRGVPGAVTVVAASALQTRVPVSTMPSLRGAASRKPALDALLAKAVPTAPPAAPSGHTALSATSSTVMVPIFVPPIPAAATMGKGIAPPAPVVPAKPVPGVDIARPVPPATVVAPGAARPTFPAAPVAPTHPITAPTPPASVSTR